MQAYDPPLDDDELEQQRAAFNGLIFSRKEPFIKAITVERDGALFDIESNKKLTKADKKALKRMRPKSKINFAQIGRVKSVGGVDYKATESGWERIGLTKVEPAHG